MKQIMICSMLMLSFYITTINAQTKTYNYQMQGKFISPSSIKLRWLPLDQNSWLKGMEYGFRLDRYIYADSNGVELNGNDLLNSKVLIQDNIICADSSIWKTRYQNNLAGNYEKLAAGAIFGKKFSLVLQDTNELVHAINANAENENRFNMAFLSAEIDFNVGLLSGYAFIDDSIAIDGTTYLYKLTSLIPNNLDSTKAILAIVKTSPIESPIIQLLGASGLEHNLSVVWKGDENEYIYYDIARKNENNEFVIVNSVPILSQNSEDKNPVNKIYTDSVALLNVPYYYKVRGVDHYGDPGPWSSTIEGISKPKPISVPPIFDSLSLITNDRIALFWKYPDTFINQIKGFGIMRSSTFNGTYTQLTPTLLPPSQKNWLDLNPLSSNYYIVIAVDTNDNQIKSFPQVKELVDYTPPAQPQNLSGHIDKKGKVSITWDSNTEADLLGYLIYFCNNIDGEYTPITPEPLKESKYSYTMDIKQLNTKTFVMITAVDNRSNYSVFSQKLELQIPDIVPPQNPNIITSSADIGVVSLTWQGPLTDVVVYHVKKRIKGELLWQNVYTSNSIVLEQSFIDSSVVNTNIYEYIVEAADAENNISYSQTVSLASSTPFRAPVTNSTVTTAGLVNALYLWWTYPDYSGLMTFQIYRSKNNAPFQSITVVTPDETLYTGTSSPIYLQGGKIYNYYDDKVTVGNNYKYKIIAQYKDGSQSEFNNEVGTTISNN